MTNASITPIAHLGGPFDGAGLPECIPAVHSRLEAEKAIQSTFGFGLNHCTGLEITVAIRK